MKSVRQKWASLKTSRRLQKCWQDYAAVAEKTELYFDPANGAASKLDAFLDAFLESYQEWSPQEEFTLERMYADCAEAALALFRAVEREATAVQEAAWMTTRNKALVVLDLMLKDEKQRQLPPEQISRILSLLEKDWNVGTKVLTLKIISTLGESDSNKIEIARLEGYKKILQLLIVDNPELTHEVVRTVNHLLEFHGDDPAYMSALSTNSAAVTLPPSSGSSTGATTTTNTVITDVSPLTRVRSSIHLPRSHSKRMSILPQPKPQAEGRHSDNIPTDQSGRDQTSNYFNGLVGIGRVSHAISEVRGLFVQELGKIFPQLKDQDGLGILGMGGDDLNLQVPGSKLFVPSTEQVQFAIAFYTQVMSPDRNSTLAAHLTLPRSITEDETSTKAPYKVSGMKKILSTPNIRAEVSPRKSSSRRNSDEGISTKTTVLAHGAALEMAEAEEESRKNQPDNVLKEFMRSQGALSSLMSTLESAESHLNHQQTQDIVLEGSSGRRLATKLDIVETVCKMLFQNSANQLEFRNMDGYSTLLRVFDQIVVPTPKQIDSDSNSLSASSTEAFRNRELGETSTQVPSESSKRSLLLNSLVSVFFDLALDGSVRDMIQNTDAFSFLFRLLLESKELDVRHCALNAIQDLISMNGLNAVAAWRCGCVDSIIEVLRKAATISVLEDSLFEGQWAIGEAICIDGASANSRATIFPRARYFGDFLVSEDTMSLADMVDNGSPVYQYLISLTRLLEYIAVLLVEDNSYILYELSRLIMELNLPTHSSILGNILVRSVSRILTDCVSRGIQVEETFMSIYLQIARTSIPGSQPLDHKSSSLAWTTDEQERDMRDMMFTEQRLLMYFAFGMVMRGVDRSIDVFDMLQGFEILTSAILLEKRMCRHISGLGNDECSYAQSIGNPDLCQDCFRSDIVASDMALWLLREYMLRETMPERSIPWLILLLKSTLGGIDDLRQQRNKARNSLLRARTTLLATKDVLMPTSALLHPSHAEKPDDQASALLTYLYTKICNTLSLLFRSCNDSKQAFGDASGMQILLSILSSAQHQEIATAALIAVGDFFAGFEGTKELLGESFGYDGFLELVLDSCRPLDKICCDVVLEVATIGRVLSPLTRPPVESGESVYCTEIWPYIAGLHRSQIFFHASLPFTTPRQTGNKRNSKTHQPSVANPKKEKWRGSVGFQSNGRSTLSRPSSMYLEDTDDHSATSFSTNSTPNIPSSSSTSTAAAPAALSGNRNSLFGMPSWANAIVPSISVSSLNEGQGIDRSTEVLEAMTPEMSRKNSIVSASGASPTLPASVAEGAHSVVFKTHSNSNSVTLGSQRQGTLDTAVVTTRKRSNSRNLGGFGLNTTSPGFGSSVSTGRLAFKQMAGIIFRDAEAARMALRLLGRMAEANNPKLVSDYFNMLMLLMEVNPRNKELFGQNDGLHFLLQILFRRGMKQNNDGSFSPNFPLPQKPTDPPFVDLVPAICAYDISVKDVRLLFDAVYDPVMMFVRLATESNTPQTTDDADTLSPLPGKSTPRFGHNRPRSESAGALMVHTGSRNDIWTKSRSIPAVNPGSFQLDPLFTTEMEFQMMYAIEKISERVDPPAYFNFDGVDACITTHPGTVEKIVQSKVGYTLSLWVKVTAFLEKESGLFCYEEDNGNSTIFELYFRSLDQSNQYSLCVRTQHYPSPAEDFVFDRFDFAQTGIWHHVVFVHGKNTMTLMVDGSEIQTYGTFNQRQQEKDSTLVGALGRKGRKCMSSAMPSPVVSDHPPKFSSSSNNNNSFKPSAVQESAIIASQQSLEKSQTLGYFCGQTGQVVFVWGLWDCPTAEKVFNLGPASTESWKSLGIQHKVLTVLDPEDFGRDQVQSTPASASSLSLVTPGSRVSASWVALHGVLRGGCTVHKTKAMRDLIDQIGGIQLCFHFLELTPPHQKLMGLRVISNLLYKSPRNILHFQDDLNGYETLFRLLNRDALDLTEDHFGALFDMASNGVVQSEHLILSNIPCVRLIIQLLPLTCDRVQGYIMRTLVDLLVESTENMRLWKKSFGISMLFQLLRTLSSHLHPFLMWTLESMMVGVTADELEQIFEFVGNEELILFDVCRDIVDMLFKHMTLDPALVEMIGTSLDGVPILIGLLNSTDEQYRLVVLKMLGILLSSDVRNGKLALQRPRDGMNLIRSTLSSFPLSMDAIQILIGIAQNCFKCDPSQRSTSPVLEKATPGAGPAKQSADRSSTSSLTKGAITATVSASKTMSFTAQLSSQTPAGDQASVSSSRTGGNESAFSRRTSQSQSLHKKKSIENSPLLTMPFTPPTSGKTSASAATVATAKAKFTDELAYWEMIQLVLELIGDLPHTDLVTHTLTDIKRILTNENMRLLWETNWVDWICSFLEAKSKTRVQNATENLSYHRALGVLDGILQKMMIFDLCRKNSITVRNKGVLVHHEKDIGIQLLLTEAALTCFDKNPILSQDSGQLVCKGLVVLYNRIDQISKRLEVERAKAEKVRAEELAEERRLVEIAKKEAEEREKSAMAAMAGAFSTILSVEQLDASDLEDSSSMFLRADGDTDAEEVAGERESDSSDTNYFQAMSATKELQQQLSSGDSSPTCSSTSTLSLPLSTYSSALAAEAAASGEPRSSSASALLSPSSIRGRAMFPEESNVNASSSSPSLTSMTPQERSTNSSPGSVLNQEIGHPPVHHPRHRPRTRQSQEHSTTGQRYSSRSSMDRVLNSSAALSNYPISSSTSFDGGNNPLLGYIDTWPPYGLYAHLIDCINNLARQNDSAFRTALKSNGLLKIRDTLVKELEEAGFSQNASTFSFAPGNGALSSSASFVVSNSSTTANSKHSSPHFQPSQPPSSSLAHHQHHHSQHSIHSQHFQQATHHHLNNPFPFQPQPQSQLPSSTRSSFRQSAGSHSQHQQNPLLAPRGSLSADRRSTSSRSSRSSSQSAGGDV